MSQGYLVTLGKGSLSGGLSVSDAAVILSINIGGATGKSPQDGHPRFRKVTPKPRTAAVQPETDGLADVMDFLRKHAGRESKSADTRTDNMAACLDSNAHTSQITGSRDAVIPAWFTATGATKNCTHARKRRQTTDTPTSVNRPLFQFRKPQPQAAPQLCTLVFGVES